MLTSRFSKVGKKFFPKKWTTVTKLLPWSSWIWILALTRQPPRSWVGFRDRRAEGTRWDLVLRSGVQYRIRWVLLPGWPPSFPLFPAPTAASHFLNTQDASPPAPVPLLSSPSGLHSIPPSFNIQCGKCLLQAAPHPDCLRFCYVSFQHLPLPALSLHESQRIIFADFHLGLPRGATVSQTVSFVFGQPCSAQCPFRTRTAGWTDSEMLDNEF